MYTLLIQKNKLIVMLDDLNDQVRDTAIDRILQIKPSQEYDLIWIS